MLLAMSRRPSEPQRAQFVTLLPFGGPPKDSEEAPIVSSHQIIPQDGKSYQPSSGQTLIAGSSTHYDTSDAVMVQTFDSRTVLVVGSSNSALLLRPTLAAAADMASTLEGHVLTVNTEGEYMVGTQTLKPGSSITIGSGTAATPVQLQTSNEVIVFIAGSVTSTLETTALAPQALTIGSQVVMADPKGQYVVGSSTLNPGDAITSPGTSVSSASSTTQVVVGSNTEGLGDQIINGLGSGPTSSVSSALPITAAAARQIQAMRMPLMLMLLT